MIHDEIFKTQVGAACERLGEEEIDDDLPERLAQMTAEELEAMDARAVELTAMGINLSVAVESEKRKRAN